ncbi:uncharacterized FCP1 homology domain-containing protein-like protein [Tanacetum coccineum]
MGTKDSKIKNAVVASDDTHLTEKEEAIKNAIVASNGSPKTEECDKKEAGIKNVVAFSDNTSIDEKQENEKEAGINLGIPMDKLSLGPKKNLLVLPLGGIIVHRAHLSRLNTIPKNHNPAFSYGYFLIYKMPYYEEFLKFCFERFEVGLWPSARKHNLTGVLTNVIGELKSKQCTDTGFKCLDNKDKPLFLKELSHLWEKKYSDLPWLVGEYSSSNTLLIIDHVKALLNHCVCKGEASVDKKDSDFDEILDDLFILGAENLRRMGQEKVQNGCDIDTSRDRNHESSNHLNFPIFSTTNEFCSICEQDVDLEKEEARVEDDDDGDTYDIWDITVKDVKRIKQFFNVPNETDEVIQSLIPQPIHITPPIDDYVAPATKSILDEPLEDTILNVTMVDKEADFNPTKDIEELERFLAKEPQSHFMEI